MRVAFVTAALCLAPALAAPQSLGDAARRRARERPTQTSSTKTYTDADLSPKGGAPEAAPPDPSAAEEPSAADAVGAARVPEPTGDDTVRAQLDREAEARTQREHAWRRQTGDTLARLAAAQREYDLVCGPGVLVLTGG